MTRVIQPMARLCFLVILFCAFSAAHGENVTVLDPPELGFFSKELICQGIAIKAHKDVSDDALREAKRRIERMLEKLPDAAANLADNGCELQIVGKDQNVSDLPELRKWKGKPFSFENGKGQSIDERTRGVGGVNCSCAEENLLKLPSDRYPDHRDICSHEFAHTLRAYGLSEDIRARIRRQYEKSTGKGLWKKAYASTNDDEFFAELTMWYFDSRGDYGELDPQPREGRDWLRQYDPDAFALLDDIYCGRLKVPRMTWEVLTAKPASDEAALRAQDSKESSRIVFVNLTTGKIQLFWLDYDGKRQAYGEVDSGQREERQTFVKHPWLVVKEDGTVAGIFVPHEARARAAVR